MKAVLVIDMPMMCCECKFFRFANNDDWGNPETICTINGKHCENGIDYKPRVCPLRPLPQKKPQSRAMGRITQDRENPNILNIEKYFGYDDGFNACIEEITGEKQ